MASRMTKSLVISVHMSFLRCLTVPWWLQLVPCPLSPLVMTLVMTYLLQVNVNVQLLVVSPSTTAAVAPESC